MYSSTAAPARSARSLHSRISAAIASRRRAAISASRISVCSAARASEASPRRSATAARSSRRRASSAGAWPRSASPCSACARRSRASASFAARRSAASCSAERLAAASASRRSAAIRRSRARSKARRAPRAASSAALSADAAARTAACALSASARSRSAMARASAASRSRSPRRFFSASRRAAAEGASAAAVKPSQRHRSPSRETSRWPGLSRARRAAPSSRATMPICASRRFSASGPCTKSDSGRTPSGRAGSSAPSPFNAQCTGADVGRGAFEILAERGAERGLVALRDGNEVEHLRPHVVGARGKELREGADLGLEALRGALGVVCRTAAARLRLARAGKHVAGFGRALVGAAQRLLGGGERGGKILGRCARRGGLDRGEVALDAGALGGEARGALVLLVQAAIERAFSGVEVGDLRLQLAELGLDRGERRLGGVKARFRLRFRALSAPAPLRASSSPSPLSRAIVAAPSAWAAFWRAMSRSRSAIWRSSSSRRSRARRSSASSSFLAWVRRCSAAAAAASASRKAGSACAATACAVAAFACAACASATGVEVLAGFALGRRRLLARLGIADREQQRLEAADLGRDVLVARGLAALLLEAVDLGVDLAQHVVDAQEIVLGGFQPQLRLVTAGVQPGDAGRVLEDAAARLRLCRDDLADLALADERRRARPGGGVGEQQLHVAGPHLAAVDAVGRALLALDAARDVELRRVVERRRRLALLVVDRERALRPCCATAGSPSRRRSRRPCRRRACSCARSRP